MRPGPPFLFLVVVLWTSVASASAHNSSAPGLGALVQTESAANSVSIFNPQNTGLSTVQDQQAFALKDSLNGQSAAVSSPTTGNGAPAAAKSLAGSLSLSSPVVSQGGALPSEYTGDGSGVTLPLEWSGAPAGTKAYALTMHHLDPEGVGKWYWTLYDIPAELTGLPKDVSGIGKVGTGFKGKVGYEPPHSRGPGTKTYILTLYALSAPVQINLPPAQVNRAVLLEAIQDTILASAELNVVYTRGGTYTNDDRPKPDPSPSTPSTESAADNAVACP